MKKINIILFIFLILFAPMIGQSVIRGPSECCLLNHDMNDIDPNCDNGSKVGPSLTPKWCDTDGDLTANETILAGGVTINWGTCCFMDTVYSVSDYFFWIFFVAAAIIFIIAGYLLLFSGGSPQKNEQGKGFLFWGVIALIIVVMAKIIPAIVKAVAV